MATLASTTTIYALCLTTFWVRWSCVISLGTCQTASMKRFYFSQHSHARSFTSPKIAVDIDVYEKWYVSHAGPSCKRSQQRIPEGWNTFSSSSPSKDTRKSGTGFARMSSSYTTIVCIKPTTSHLIETREALNARNSPEQRAKALITGLHHHDDTTDEPCTPGALYKISC